MKKTDVLVDGEVSARLSGLAGWKRDGGAIEKAFVFGDFSQAFRFLTGVALLAERSDHHPEIWNVYNRVTLRLTTHDAGGLTLKDLSLAEDIEGLL